MQGASFCISAKDDLIEGMIQDDILKEKLLVLSALS